MPNHLSIPFKVTYDIDVKEPVRQFISLHTGSHPDEFKADISRWQALRKDGVGGTVAVERIDAAIRYNAQLAAVLTKFPSDIGLEIPYAPVFKPSSLPIVLKNVMFERASVLFNLAALYSQLSFAQDRSTVEGIKRAKAYCENSAGTLSHLGSAVLPQLVYDPSDEEIPMDLSPSFVKSLEWLMLAQAQECAWQMATMNSHLYKNGVLAKLAAQAGYRYSSALDFTDESQAASLYQTSLTLIRDASPAIKHIFPKDWLTHLETKQLHFQATSQYRRSLEDIDASRYGAELGRLYIARVDAKKGHDLARYSGVNPAVVQDIRSLLDMLQKNIARAERDNDLIYHQDVPDASGLPPTKGAMMCNISVPPGLSNPSGAVGNDSMLFAELLGWGAREAINIYNHNKETLVKDQVIDVAAELDDKINRTLQELNLPSSLEALERPIGLPPSLLRKAEEVRLEDGVAKVETSIESVLKLAEQVIGILNEAMDILDGEADEDEAARSGHSLQRPASHVANKDLIEKEARYRDIVGQARASDEVVRAKWDEWEKNISELMLDETALEALVPSSANSRSTRHGAQTQRHARSLRVLLESLDDLRIARSQLVERARMLMDADDVRSVITRKAAGFEQFTDVQPSMFDDISETELAKYDKFLREIRNTEQKQETILNEIRAQNEAFLQSRREDPSLKEREHALQSMDLAYHKYREITRNLDEGLKFYDDLTGILTEFKNTCMSWSRNRKLELRSLVHAIQEITDAQENGLTMISPHPEPLQSPPLEERMISTPSPVPEPESRSQRAKIPASLTFESDDWEDLKLPPAPVKAPTSKKHDTRSRKKVAQGA